MRLTLLLVAVLLGRTIVAAESEEERRVAQVATTKGLIAFWDFSLTEDGAWTSYHDEDVAQPAIRLPEANWRSAILQPDHWPHSDEQSKLVSTRPARSAAPSDSTRLRLWRSTPSVFVSRRWTSTAINVHLIAWGKFIGARLSWRNLVEGLDKFGAGADRPVWWDLRLPGVIGHVSATGAASFRSRPFRAPNTLAAGRLTGAPSITANGSPWP